MDINILEQRYQALQKQFHPDRFAIRSSKEKRLSLEHVIRLNEAYQTLKNPYTRSAYLLKRVGHDPSDKGHGSKTDPAFLMEIMEIQEALDAIDLTSGQATIALETLRQQTDKRIVLEQKEIARLFDLFASSSDLSLLEQIARANNRLRYHGRFLETLDWAEESIETGRGDIMVKMNP